MNLSNMRHQKIMEYDLHGAEGKDLTQNFTLSQMIRSSRRMTLKYFSE